MLARHCIVRVAGHFYGHKSTLGTSQRSSTRVVRGPGGAAAVRREDVLIACPDNNVTEYIFEKIGVDLHRRPEHPLGILKNAIMDYFDETYGKNAFRMFDDLHPIVSSYENFDSVLVPEDHVSRSKNDTYYVTADTVLRCHTSAHQLSLLKQGEKRFLVTGDVYRRDSIDATHFPVFHQMEGVRVFTQDEIAGSELTGEELASQELKNMLEGLARHLFGEVEMRWVDAYFPFTNPSYELEIYFNGEWLEVLGCGVMETKILNEASLVNERAWAFGLGLERLAMVLFDIPDIRLFWTDDARFLKQFKPGMFRSGGVGMQKFKSYSKYPPCYKDVSFWLPDESTFTENNLCEIVRATAGDIVEEVKLIDEFRNPKTDKVSNCFRISYRSMDRSLTDDEINELQETVRESLVEKLGVTLR
ncbi:phenylalanine-tRNA synthetase, probable [Ostreococcus lucimarinus CCE9901]|uniref:phenylalanine--tRNA ligase n=1 Tax=Ostreococcus lucimarinus (strain CCE9901) TaxID=436017 RepID=A4RSR3_OSTLU|nr:phenylalanine-tRNA synthetase, probable [Ostreococcus lucimarinus CCE9901]ABO94495.1 phenylalanine-tRNA synthetase, probable [Ostreococcus lucimarinus CCE9901]|eukprot:XP_001416202.1 phenylalanine-tRNA synthetase, probable [Ostreococcus lucimarinus CCE9901]